MRFDIVEKHFLQDQTADQPVFSGVSIGFQTSLDNRGHIRGEFMITGKAFENWYKSGESIESLAETMINECLRLDKLEVDAQSVESAKRRLQAVEAQNLETALLLSQIGGEA